MHCILIFGELNVMYLPCLIVITICIIGVIIKGLFIKFKHGKLITKVDDLYYKRFIILWIVMLILFILCLYKNIKFYIDFKEHGFAADTDLFNIYNSIFWIEIIFFNLFKCSVGSEIRENGIYKYGFFYKWSKIKSFIWISPTVIQFKVKSFFIFNIKFEMPIKDDLKIEINELLQRHLNL